METHHQTRLDEVVATLELSNDVRQIACAICNRVFAQDLHHYHSAEAVIASSVYAAARHVGVPFEVSTITEIVQVDRTVLERTYTLLTEELDGDLDLESPHPHELVARYCSELAVDTSIESTAHEVVDEFTETGLHAGCLPSGVAAGAVYLAARLTDGETLTQDEVTTIAGVSEMALRQRYQEQQEVLGITDTYRGTARPLKLRKYRTLSAAELNTQLADFDVLDKPEGSVRDAHVRCIYCNTTGKYDDLRGTHSADLCRER